MSGQRLILTYLIAVLALVAVPLVAVLAVSVAVSPEAIESGTVQLTEPCPLRAAGEPCATCGLTRSFTAMSRAQLSRAWAYNRLGPPLYLATWLGLAGVVALIVRLLRLARSPTPGVPSPPEDA